MDKLLKMILPKLIIKRNSYVDYCRDLSEAKIYENEVAELNIIIAKIQEQKYNSLAELSNDLGHSSRDILLNQLISLFEGLDMLGLFDGILSREPPVVVIPGHRKKRRHEEIDP